MGRLSILSSIRSLATKVIAYFKSSSFEKVVLRIAFVCLAAAMLFDPGRDTLQISQRVLRSHVSVCIGHILVRKDIKRWISHS